MGRAAVASLPPANLSFTPRGGRGLGRCTFGCSPLKCTPRPRFPPRGCWRFASAHRLTGQLYTRDTIHALGYHGHLVLYGNETKGRADRLRRANEALVTLQHTVGVTEVAVMFQRAAKTEQLDMEWLTTPAFQTRYKLKDVKIERPTKTGALNETLPIAPDGFAIVDGQHYFIEFDCATEPIERSSYRRSALEKKFEAYWQLYKTRTNQDHDLPGFQVLTVLTPYRLGEDIDRRLMSVLSRAGEIRPGGKSQFFLVGRFTDLRAVGDGVLRDPTWIVPGEPEFQPLFLG